MYVPYWESSGPSKSTRLERLNRNTEGLPSTGPTMDFDIENRGNTHLWVKNLCRLRSSWQENLGQNLFNGLGPTLDKDLTSPLKLATELIGAKALLKNEPALVCVGCNLVGVWNTPMKISSVKNVISKENVAEKADPQVTEKHPIHRPGVKIVDINTGSSEAKNTNAASIACVVLWGASPGHVSHYLAGDSYWEQEDPLVSWIAQSGEPIGSIKLSHHGSESSSPAVLFALKPRSIIASAGTLHGHPREAPPKVMEIS